MDEWIYQYLLRIMHPILDIEDSDVVLVIKNLPANAGDRGDLGSIPGSGRSPGEGNGNPLQYLAWRITWAEEPGGL